MFIIVGDSIQKPQISLFCNLWYILIPISLDIGIHNNSIISTTILLKKLGILIIQYNVKYVPTVNIFLGFIIFILSIIFLSPNIRRRHIPINDLFLFIMYIINIHNILLTICYSGYRYT